MVRIFFLLTAMLISWSISILTVTGEKSVYIVANNLEQVITSSTLKWIPWNVINDTILEQAVVAAYQVTTNDATDTSSNGKKTKIYVCRMKSSSIWVSGHVVDGTNICVSTMYKTLQVDQYDVLLNVGNRSRLIWMEKTPFILNYTGAVSSDENNIGTIVARMPSNIPVDSENFVTHFVGAFAPHENLGTYHLTNAIDNSVHPSKNGEILVEKEPISYDLRIVRFDKIRQKIRRKHVVLGSAILINPENGVRLVESVIGYNYTHAIHWGKHNLITGLPFSVESKKHDVVYRGKWALKNTTEKSEVSPIQMTLDGETAVNVTVSGELVDVEMPYVAVVVAKYDDNQTRERHIGDVKREQGLMNVTTEFGPIYFLSNYSLVPTTTTTTTTTTTPVPTTPTTESTTIPTTTLRTDKNQPPPIPPNIDYVTDKEGQQIPKTKIGSDETSEDIQADSGAQSLNRNGEKTSLSRSSHYYSNKLALGSTLLLLLLLIFDRS